MSEEPENVVVVAVRAEREISKAALGWTLTHVVRPGDLVTLLAVLPDDQESKLTSWRRRWLSGFPRFSGDFRNRRRERCQISASCSQMALQIDGRNEINVRIKVVGSEVGGVSSGSSSCTLRGGVVAAESKRVGANWVVLDKQLKQEEKHCIEQLQCNVVAMKGSSAKVLRLNLHRGRGPRKQRSPSSSPSFSCSEKLPSGYRTHSSRVRAGNSLVRESRELASTSSTGGGGGGGEAAASLFLGEQINPLYEGSSTGKLSSKEDVGSDDACVSVSDGSGGGTLSPFHTSQAQRLEFRQHGAQRESSSSSSSSSSGFHPEDIGSYRPAASLTPLAPVERAERNQCIAKKSSEDPFLRRCRDNHNKRPPTATKTTLQEKFSESDRESVLRKLLGLHPSPVEDYCYSASYSSAGTREASSPSIPPPLCSLCRHKAPVFGKPPRRFSYRELEEATDGFSDRNFVADGGFGCVHRGALGDGQVVAIKRLKPAAVSADPRKEEVQEFHGEVEVLSSAQHRNVVMLVGFCVEGKRRMLVYEYICNGSLDQHLHGHGRPALDWNARVKIARGVARGLRYLHEDCRVGFVVHKDMRPTNILLTHDFEPLIGDFSLVKWQTERSLSADSRIAETFGYLAPEYIEDGIITEKADVYAFGVVLLEIMTGRRAVDTTQPKGRQFLVDWARPLLSLVSEERVGQTVAVNQLLDPCIDPNQARLFSHSLQAMACAASLCLCRDPHVRPTMSKVLRVLEGNAFLDPGLDIGSAGSKSGRTSCPMLHQQTGLGGSISLRFTNEAAINSLYDAQRSWSRFS